MVLVLVAWILVYSLLLWANIEELEKCNFWELIAVCIVFFVGVPFFVGASLLEWLLDWMIPGGWDDF